MRKSKKNNEKQLRDSDSRKNVKDKKRNVFLGCFGKKKRKEKTDKNKIYEGDSPVDENQLEVVESTIESRSAPQMEFANQDCEYTSAVMETIEDIPIKLEMETDTSNKIEENENNENNSVDSSIKEKDKDEIENITSIREKTRSIKNSFLGFDPSKFNCYSDQMISEVRSRIKSRIDSSYNNDNRISTPDSSNRNSADVNDPAVINDELETSELSTWQPKGFRNPIGYCYLNSVIQVLGSCEDFKKDFLANYLSDCSENDSDSCFVNGIFKLFHSLKDGTDDDIEHALEIVQCYITESSTGDDVYKCFMNILTRISNVMKNIENKSEKIQPINGVSKADTSFKRFRNKEPQFVFDNFYGQLAFQIVCKDCNHVCNESFQMMKSLALPVPLSEEPVDLEDCIALFSSGSDLDMDENQDCDCDGGSRNLNLITKITHSPKYLFIYLNRGSYFTYGEKNDTYVKCESNIKIETTLKQSFTYKLISVIDHSGNNQNGHYYCKCSYETDTWWSINDEFVEKLDKTDQIVSGNTIVFLFKRH